MAYQRISAEKSILRLFGQGFDVPTDLLDASGLAEENAPRYRRDVGLFAGHLAACADPIKALMLTASDRAHIKAEQDASTSKQKIAEIERDTAEARREAAEVELKALGMRTTTVIQDTGEASGASAWERGEG